MSDQAKPQSQPLARVVRAIDIKSYPDPETKVIEIVTANGRQSVTHIGDFGIGELGVFIEPNAVVPIKRQFEWLWRPEDWGDMYVPAKRRRITVRKFRGQRSEGLLLPLSDFRTAEFALASDRQLYIPSEGDEVTERLRITRYVPEVIERPKVFRHQKRRYPRSFHGWCRFLWFKLFGRSHSFVSRGGTNAAAAA